ncbi:MAG: hypothetical protein P8R04_04415, partial [Gammaproteobacteria bacterium]|nr:hypothetical protein [Gammaproteobacteria bacterium]
TTLLNRGCGLLAKPFDVKSYSESLLSLLNNRGDAASIGTKGKKIVTEEYSFSDYVAQLLELSRATKKDNLRQLD